MSERSSYTYEIEKEKDPPRAGEGKKKTGGGVVLWKVREKGGGSAGVARGGRRGASNLSYLAANPSGSDVPSSPASAADIMYSSASCTRLTLSCSLTTSMP